MPKLQAFWVAPLIAGLIAALLTSPALASAKTDILGALASIQQRDEMVQSIGWNLITGRAAQRQSAPGHWPAAAGCCFFFKA
jgi:hypothetical protein